MNLQTRKIRWQNLLTKNKSADKRNLQTESADKNQICWQKLNLLGTSRSNSNAIVPIIHGLVLEAGTRNSLFHLVPALPSNPPGVFTKYPKPVHFWLSKVSVPFALRLNIPVHLRAQGWPKSRGLENPFQKFRGIFELCCSQNPAVWLCRTSFCVQYCVQFL